MKVKERQDMIMALLQKEGQASVEDLANYCGRSLETIRRDLSDLAEMGRVQKIHGGAKMPPMRSENHLSRRMQVCTDEKRAIGHVLAEKVSSGDMLFMDTGSTTYYCAEALMSKSSICVITNSLDIAEMLGKNDTIQVILLGGAYYGDNKQLLGSLTLRDIEFYRPDMSIITIGGIDHSGIMDYNVKEATVAAAMIRNSIRTIVVADHLKLDRSCAFKVASLEDIHELITDTEPNARLSQSLKEHQIAVHIANTARDPQQKVAFNEHR